MAKQITKAARPAINPLKRSKCLISNLTLNNFIAIKTCADEINPCGIKLAIVELPVFRTINSTPKIRKNIHQQVHKQ